MAKRTWQWSCQKTLNRAEKHCPKRQTAKDKWEDFFKALWRGVTPRKGFCRHIHAHLFQSMANSWTSLMKDVVDSVLLSLSTSPHPTPPSCALSPTTWLKPAPNPSLHQTVAWEGFEPPCRYCSSFQISNSLLSQMSICAALVYIQRDGLCFVLFFHFASFKFGLSSKVRARTLVHEMKPHILLIVWFVVSILMKWNPSCRIFCIARIVRQWEDGGAIWREFSYWMEPHQLPIGCHII